MAAANAGSNNITVRLGAGPPADAGNLLTNGGAEGAGAARNSTTEPAVPGWSDTTALTHVRYGTFGGFPDRFISDRVSGQQAFLAAARQHEHLDLTSRRRLGLRPLDRRRPGERDAAGLPRRLQDLE